MAKIASKSIRVPASREEAEQIVEELTLTKLNEIKLTAERDEKIAAESAVIRASYADQLRECGEAIETKIAALELWAQQNPKLFVETKSIEFPAGKIGFRTGNPALALLNRKWNWEKVLAAVQQILPNFVRQSPEVDKEAILGQRDELKEFLPLVGLKVAQDESFYVEPDITKVNTREKKKVEA